MHLHFEHLYQSLICTILQEISYVQYFVKKNLLFKIVEEKNSICVILKENSNLRILISRSYRYITITDYGHPGSKVLSLLEPCFDLISSPSLLWKFKSWVGKLLKIPSPEGQKLLFKGIKKWLKSKIPS